MKSFFLICGFLLLASTPAFAAVKYSGVIEDLPLMPGMTERPDDAVIFENPEGRIVETGAETSAAAPEVKNFYAQNLPPLGWKALSSSAFVRNGETLELGTEQKGKGTIVHFSLTPQNEGK